MERNGRIDSHGEAAGSSQRFILEWRATIESNRVTCITKPHPHSPLEHITHVGGVNSQGQSWYYARQRVADMIDSGTKIARFNVEVISVLKDFNPKTDGLGPNTDIVLIRCSGQNLEHTGAIEGMSGSPIYLKDDTGKYRMIGAFAYGWPLAKDPIGGVQTIEQMLKLSPERRHQTSVSVAPGQRQGVKPQHGRVVVIATATGLQQAADTAVHLGQSTGHQSLRQCHLQQISSGVGGEPGPQVGVHPIGQMRPGPAVHEPPLLGRHNFAGDLRLGIAPRDEQVIGRIVFQPGEGNREATRDLQRRGAQHVEHRHQRAVAGERGSQPVTQPPPASRAQRTRQRHRVPGQPYCVKFSHGRRPGQCAAQPFDRQFKRVALADCLSRPRPARGISTDLRHARRPQARARQRDERVERRWIVRRRLGLHSRAGSAGIDAHPPAFIPAA